MPARVPASSAETSDEFFMSRTDQMYNTAIQRRQMKNPNHPTSFPSCEVNLTTVTERVSPPPGLHISCSGKCRSISDESYRGNER